MLLCAQIDAVIEYARRYADEVRDRSAVRRIGSLWDEGDVEFDDGDPDDR